MQFTLSSSLYSLNTLSPLSQSLHPLYSIHIMLLFPSLLVPLLLILPILVVVPPYHHEPMYISMVALGDRGVVQPFIALGQHLKDRGHFVKLFVEERLASLVTSFGLEHRVINSSSNLLNDDSTAVDHMRSGDHSKLRDIDGSCLIQSWSSNTVFYETMNVRMQIS